MKELKIGRLPHNDIVIDDLSVSREHAVLIFSENEYVITDLDSSNGTFVNGNRVKGGKELKRNDILKVGTVLVPWMNYLSKANNTNSSSNTFQAHIHNNENGKIELPESKAILILGILGVVFSFVLIGIVLNVIAISMGAQAISKYETEPNKYTEQSFEYAKNGRILGVVGIGLVVVVLSILISQN